MMKGGHRSMAKPTKIPRSATFKAKKAPGGEHQTAGKKSKK